MGKAYKKKTSRKKPTCGGKKKRFSRRKMKGGVAFNTSFSTSTLPSSTYIPLNPNVNDNPSWNQIDARLLPAMKGGRRTRKKRGGNKEREKYVKYAIYKGFIDQLEGALKLNPELATPELLNYAQKNSDKDNKDEIIEMIKDKMKQKGGKKKKRKTKGRKMKGGSLVGTDLLTGINTTDTNSALAFGTTGGTNYMLDTMTAKEVSTGEYMSPELKPIPLV